MLCFVISEILQVWKQNDKVWKRVSKMTIFGLKGDENLKNRAIHPIKSFQEYTSPPPRG